ncbi:glutamate--cysteine ligase [Antrihabitans sp. YC2-6]|uniref:glutamate--cysteine ligase 2 n=1 Tax=Antrihabitans sp. YC2-6 TaxID=2799498 RepID=UPI0018F2A2EA|nr:glutamate--cysteine ligase [Antrihabitans sp. YC2-6]MBJ8347820.1 glutamate--cysteine ligase [Antrihabitans sp. YC2-6]
MSDLPTVGVEEEFLLVHPQSGYPAPRNKEVAAAAADTGVELQLELTTCQVETTSPVATSAAQLRKQLVDLRKTVVKAAETVGVRALAVAVPPDEHDEFPVTDTPRYRRIDERFGAIAREQGICGCHVHVEIPDVEVAIRVSNHLRPWLPTLLALTANSAVYRGVDTGYASWRSVLWSRWPSAGPPPYLRDADHHRAIVEMMLASGAIVDDRMIYWDVRLSTHLPTVEVRVSDVPATVDETVLLATLVRAAVITAMRQIDDGEDGPHVAAEILRVAYWKAAHDGLTGDAIDALAGRVIPAADMVRTLVDHVRPALEDLGEYQETTELLDSVLARGNGAVTQRNALRERGAIADVVDACAHATNL